MLNEIAPETENEDRKVQKRALAKLTAAKNIAEQLEDGELALLADLVISELDIDESHPKRQDKIDRWTAGEKLATQQRTRSTGVWADEHYPLLVDAIIKFNAHAMPVIIAKGKVIKKKVLGKDRPQEQQTQSAQSAQGEPGIPGPTMQGQQNQPIIPANNLMQIAGLQGNMPARRSKNQIAEDMTDFMNYQLMSEMTEWARDTDKLLLRLAAYGVMYRKIWYSKIKGRPCSKLLSPMSLIVPPGLSIMDAPRISEYYWLAPNEIKSYIRSGLFLDFSYQIDGDDTEAMQEMVEQRRWIDLDEDGYKEPYVVTVHKASSRICRIVADYTMDDVELGDDRRVARIVPRETYVEYVFVESIEDDGLPLGFYDLLGPINRTINKSTNQMLDAGMLASSNSGFIAKNLKISKGNYTLKVGHFNAIDATGDDIRKGIVQMQYPGPSPVLFQLMQFLLVGAKELANTQNIMENAQRSNMPATTTMAIIEQGAKVANSVYKRIYRSATQEFKILKRINAENLMDSQYIRIIDAQVTAEDFKDYSMDFEPVADPEEITDLQRMAKAEFLMSMLNNPMLDARVISQRILEAANIADTDELLAKPAPPPPPDPRIQIELAKLELEKARIDLDTKKFQLAAMELEVKNRETDSRILKNRSASIVDLADAEAKEAGQQLQLYQQRLSELEQVYHAKKQQAEANRAQQEIDLERGRQQLSAQSGTGTGAGEGIQQPSAQPAAAQPIGINPGPARTDNNAGSI